MEQTASNSSVDQASVDMECSATVDDFIATGRTGRRNAMPDILDSQKAGVGTGGLAFDMEKLNCSDNDKTDGASQSTANPSTSQGS